MSLRPSLLALALLPPGLLGPARPLAGSGHLVLVDPGKGEEYLQAAEEMALLHKAPVARFRAAAPEEALERLRDSRPRWVVFVLPPDEIDVDLCHRILEMSTRLDDDPFPDFEYGFVTGRDGEAARRFVARIALAWKREFGRKGAMLGSWEGPLPFFRPVTAARSLGLSFSAHLIPLGGAAEARREKARTALQRFTGLDLLLFFSHGWPDEMVGCFRAADLREWKVDLSPAVLINCACYNGAPGRWFEEGPEGARDRGMVRKEDSVALALLDSGLSAYFAGIDPWHGPLANQLFGYLADEGLRLGEAAKRMADRLALEFLPGRIRFQPTAGSAGRGGGEGTVNRRLNGAGMVFYGDPALAPFAKDRGPAAFAELERPAEGKARVRVGFKPLLSGFRGVDSMLAEHRLLDYYSVRSPDWQKDLAAEVYRVLPLPAGAGRPRLRVVSARSGEREVPAGEPQLEVEEAHGERLLHLRVPLPVPMAGGPMAGGPMAGGVWPERLARGGVEVVLEGEL